MTTQKDGKISHVENREKHEEGKMREVVEDVARPLGHPKEHRAQRHPHHHDYHRDNIVKSQILTVEGKVKKKVLNISAREDVDEQVEELDEQTGGSPKEGVEGEISFREEEVASQN